jgi:hypothetical protein
MRYFYAEISEKFRLEQTREEKMDVGRSTIRSLVPTRKFFMGERELK